LRRVGQLYVPVCGGVCCTRYEEGVRANHRLICEKRVLMSSRTFLALSNRSNQRGRVSVFRLILHARTSCLTINIIIGPVSLRRSLHGGAYDRLLVSQTSQASHPMSWLLPDVVTHQPCHMNSGASFAGDKCADKLPCWVARITSFTYWLLHRIVFSDQFALIPYAVWQDVPLLLRGIQCHVASISDYPYPVRSANSS
jgi:hypothetical protein